MLKNRTNFTAALFLGCLILSQQPALAGPITEIGTFGGASSFANAINASGQVTGYAYTASGDRHAFLYTGGVLVDLGTLAGFSQSFGLAINSDGTVVGTATQGGIPSAAFISTPLNTLDSMGDAGSEAGSAT
jgi:probable HAF family extracellular repeat protein